MAEIAVAAFSAIGTAVEGAVGAAGAGLSSLVGFGSTALSVLSGVATAASVAATLSGGKADAANANAQAQITELQGNADFLQSQQKALAIQRDLIQKVGAARVAFAGSGLDISSSDAVVGDLTTQAGYETAIEKSNAQQAKITAEMRARAYRSNADSDLSGASARALGQVASFGLDIARRG